MKEKKISILIMVILILQIYSFEVNASVKPIITTKMPPQLEIGLYEVTLDWYIIDDNLHLYSIYKNSSIFKDNVIASSNFINLPFSDVEGVYNITLQVTDYSNNTASNCIIIIVNHLITYNTEASSSSQSGAGAPGFTLFDVFIIGILILIIKSKKQKKKD